MCWAKVVQRWEFLSFCGVAVLGGWVIGFPQAEEEAVAGTPLLLGLFLCSLSRDVTLLAAQVIKKTKVQMQQRQVPAQAVASWQVRLWRSLLAGTCS